MIAFVRETFKFFKKNVVHQHNDLAPAAIEQQITNHYSSSLWNDSSFKKCCEYALLECCTLAQYLFSFKNVVRQHNDLAPAAIEQQIILS